MPAGAKSKYFCFIHSYNKIQWNGVGYGLEENEICMIREIELLWKDTSPSKQELALTMIRAVLEHQE